MMAGDGEEEAQGLEPAPPLLPDVPHPSRPLVETLHAVAAVASKGRGRRRRGGRWVGGEGEDVGGGDAGQGGACNGEVQAAALRGERTEGGDGGGLRAIGWGGRGR